MTRDALAAFIEACRREQPDISLVELRDIVYLARHLDRSANVAEQPQFAECGNLPGSEPVLGPVGATPDEAPPAPYPHPRADVATSDSGPDAQPKVGLQASPDWTTDAVLEAGPHALLRPYSPYGGIDQVGTPIPVTMAPALARAPFAAAIRPLRRMVRSGSGVELDVAATVKRLADSEWWEPVLVASADRWLSLAVVVDEGASGPAWTDEIHELLRALVESSAFSGIRIWRFSSDQPGTEPLTLRGGTRSSSVGRSPDEVLDPSRRRAILVLSDCVGTAWGDGRVGAMVRDWGASGPVAIVQLLPQRLWGRCQPRLVPVEWRATRPRASGVPAAWRYRGDPSPNEAVTLSGVLVPVLDFTGPAFGQWAALVAGRAPRWLPGMAFDTADIRPDADPLAVGADDPDEPDVEDDDSHRLRVTRFRAAASPEAFRLATLLSACPLYPALIREVQRTLLGIADAAPWAEILLSGLVEQAPGGTGNRQPEYDFKKGIRDQLLSGLNEGARLDLLHAVSELIIARLGGTLHLLALLTLDTPSAEPTGVDRAFARVAVHVLAGLGHGFAKRVTQVNHDLRLNVPINYVKKDITPPLGVPVGVHPTDGAAVAHAGLTDIQQAVWSPRAGIWEMPPRTPNFTGRKDLLESLHRELVENPNQAAVLVPRALYGLGGVGKTALANEYAYRYRQEYEVVWWIPAEDSADIRRSLVQLSQALRLPETTDQSETIRTLLRALHDGYPRSRWLLIYDNAIDPETINAYLPSPRSDGHILITSRDQSWARRGALLTVDKFVRAESTTLLRRRAPHLTADDAEQVAELLGDLPLALHQAAAWHAETEQSPLEYREQYDQKLARLAGADLAHDYPPQVGAAFGVSYDQLKARSLAAAQLLQLCSHFGPEPIYVEMLYRARNVPGLPNPLSRQMADRSTISRELREIARYELVKFDQARARFQLHRLVQTVLRRTLPDEQRQTTPIQAHSLLALANPGNPDELPAVELARHAELSPHIGPSGIVESDDPEARRVVLDQIRYRYLIGDYAGSKALAESTVTEWTRRWGDRDELVLLSRRHLATTLRSLGDPIGATQTDEEVMQLFRETLGERDDHYLVTANGYGADLRALGRFQKALNFDRELLAQHREALREEDPATLRTANNYAVDLRLMGQYQLALDLDTRTVQLWTEGYGPEHAETLFAVSNLVRDLYGLGRYGEAFNQQQQALVAHEGSMGPNHPSVLLARRTMAMLLRKLGRYREARELAEVTHAAYTARFSEHHEYTLAATMSLSNALRDEDRDRPSLVRAREQLDRALYLYGLHFPGHPFGEVCLTNLAITLRRLGEVALARQHNTTAHQNLKEKLGEQHPYTLCSATNLANDLALLDDYRAARRLSELVLDVSRRPAVRGPDHPYTLGSAICHALNLEATGDAPEADALFTDTIARFERILGSDHPDTLAARGRRRRIDADIEPPPT